MEKPVKQYFLEPMLSYTQAIKFIEDKYKIEVRDYHRTYSKDKDDYRHYMDFWHWLIEETGLKNGTEIYLNIDELLEDDDVLPWIKEILTLIKNEFDLDEEGGISFWVSW